MHIETLAPDRNISYPVRVIFCFLKLPHIATACAMPCQGTVLCMCVFWCMCVFGLEVELAASFCLSSSVPVVISIPGDAHCNSRCSNLSTDTYFWILSLLLPAALQRLHRVSGGGEDGGGLKDIIYFA